MAKPKSNNDYKKLKEIWYKKLAKSGFEDIELDENTLKKGTRSSEFARPRSVKSWRSKEAYYYMATHFLHEHTFTSSLERAIWEYHSNGISGRDIARLLTSVRSKKINRMTVWRIVKKLNVIMKATYPHMYGETKSE